MDSISVLRYCASVLLVREVTDLDRRWQWTMRRRLVNWALARAERAAGPAPSEGSLSLADRRQIESTHPWLQPIVPIVLPAMPAMEDVARSAIANRIDRYSAAASRRQRTNNSERRG
jgi:hypothetical protein